MGSQAHIGPRRPRQRVTSRNPQLIPVWVIFNHSIASHTLDSHAVFLPPPRSDTQLVKIDPQGGALRYSGTVGVDVFETEVSCLYPA